MTGMGSSPLRLGAFAGDNSAFGCGCSPTGEPLFPSEVWEKACITMLQNLPATRKFYDHTKHLRLGDFSRQGAKSAKFG
jgi:hypothetical protein